MWKAKLAARVIVTVALAVVTAGAFSVLWLYHHEPARPRHVSRAHTTAVWKRADPPIQHYIGAYAPGEPGSYQPVRNFAEVAGRQPNITTYYSVWGAPLAVRFLGTAAQAGAIVVVQMGPGSNTMADIAAGRGDSYLRQFADEVRGYGGPVVLSWAAEPDNRAHPWGWERSPSADWVAAWKHVVTLFRSEGAGNARWLWDMGGGSYATGRVHQYWPGGRYVDWVGVNAYFVSPDKTYQYVVGDLVAAIRRFTSKPIILPESGVGPLAGQAATIPKLFAGIRRDGLLGLIWFDEPQNQGVDHQDWRLEGDRAGIRAFRAGVRSLRDFAP